ncbi:MAG: YidC/Oxa1 family membrane protein insertase [Patescibacteria group bacterium]|nr:YidC/Oxa1 family membrane protein insertase [Patescibacteria group bacterium]
MSQIFHSFIYQPIYNALIFLYNVIPGHDLGVAIILLTVLIRFLLYPVAQKQIESQKKLQDLQPEIKKLQDKYKGDKEKQGRALMEFYKEKKVNPASGCLPLVVQIIFFIALYRAFIAGLNFDSGCSDLYSFVSCPASINVKFFGLLDLAKPNFILAIIAAASQFVQTKMMMTKTPVSSKKDDFSSIMNKQMLYIGPLLTLFIGLKFPAGLAIYWIANTLFAIGQQYLIMKKPEGERARTN